MPPPARPRIVCAGMLDTKGPEIRHLAEMVAASGGEPIVMDLSLGAMVDWADVSLPEVLATTDTGLEDVFAAPRADAIELVGRAGARKILELRAAGRCDGIISWAGSVGTTTATRVMRALPLGVPKVMLTDMASSDVSQWLGDSDIYLTNPIAEQGINAITRKAVANAAAAVVAMARVPDVPAGSRPLAAITSYGSTTPTVLRCQAYLEARGWDTIIFHAVGVGATMEDLIRAGRIGALIDLTTAELTNTLLGSVYGIAASWDGRRLTAAADAGIPQVVAPGGLDQVAWGPLATVPVAYLEDIRSGRRHSYGDSGVPYRHNDGVTILVPTLAEIDEIAAQLAERLVGATGPTALLIPMRGWSAYDQSAALATRERGWPAGHGDGPTWEPDPAHPMWSRKATRMLAVLRERLPRDHPRLDLIACDRHILDPAFADLLERCMGEMLDGTWRPGHHRDLDGILPDDVAV